ncbi:MAG: hypothetical protein HFF17_07245 [Oscillospiraceae bacterium]|nr:hypothetical protein [Oscillospiraceae bacterium]
MKLRMPRYFDAFRCAAGACPDTCCRDWEVALDEDALRNYRQLEGPLGAAVRAAMAERDGETVLALRGGLCPLLDTDGLCRIQRTLGEAHLCRACVQHPRFAEEYGALQEWCLSLACPETARLLLAETEPMTFPEAVSDEPVHGCNDLDARLFYALLTARRTAFTLAQDRSAPWQTRLARVLDLAAAWQRALDQHRLSRLDAVTARFAAGRFPPAAPGTRPEYARRLLARLEELEPINDAWAALLGTALAEETPAGDFALEAEQLLVYGLYRYWLKAVTDRRLLPRVQLSALLALWGRALAQGRSRAVQIDRIHRLSRAVEHSPENLETVLRWCETDPDFSPAALTAAAW